MLIGLFDVDSHNFPNLCLMKISAYHKSKGDTVEWLNNFMHYDIVYVSKVFGDEYSKMDLTVINADKIYYGGTGFAISVNSDGREYFDMSKNNSLPEEIEHIYPDYSLYPELTKDTAYGFLTRGCPNNCSFCIVSKKEGVKSVKVANLSEFWSGQKYIKLLDPNILACPDRIELLKQLRDSKARIDFTQGLDARFITEEVALLLKDIKKEGVHFAFDFMKNEKRVLEGLEIYKNICGLGGCAKDCTVYILTNYDTTHEEDMYRVNKVTDLGFYPYVMIYRKTIAPQITRHLQRWSNNRFLFKSCSFEDYEPYGDGRKIKDLFKE